MQATRARVLRAIAELDYEPDPSARNLRSGTTFVIGLVYDNPNPYHIIGVQNGVLAACRETGFGLQIHPCDSSSPLLADELADWVQRSRLAGLVLTAPMSERRDLIQALTARGIKLVRIIAATEDPADGACVFVDDREAAYEITEHLIQLGHQRIGFLWGGISHRSSGERYAGYEAALKDYGMTVDKHLVVQGDYTFDEGFRGARRLLARGCATPLVTQLKPILRTGFAGGADFAKGQATEAKGAWKAAAGEQWGSQKAEGWQAEIPPFNQAALDKERADLAALDSRIDATAQSLGALEQKAAAYAAARDQLAARQAKAAQLPALRQKLDFDQEEHGKLAARPTTSTR
ncbi:hypothetical protein G6F68_010800 [Rhizopus microsporus]|nr:hypothetical protein G6F68_010800 [Rhizopus microsporus]